MTQIELTKCDGVDCEKYQNHSNPTIPGPTFHSLSIGGSDFEMSFGGEHTFDFCSIECLRSFLDKHYPQERK